MKVSLENPVGVFKSFSIVITGFSRLSIQQTGNLRAYFLVVKDGLGEEHFYEILSVFSFFQYENCENLNSDERDYIDNLITSEFYGASIEQMKKLWYFGVWEDC